MESRQSIPTWWWEASDHCSKQYISRLVTGHQINTRPISSPNKRGETWYRCARISGLAWTSYTPSQSASGSDIRLAQCPLRIWPQHYMGVNVCSARLDDFGAYPGFREPHLGARRSRNCLHLLEICACRASTFRDEEYVCCLGHVDLCCFLRRTVAVPRRILGRTMLPATRPFYETHSLHGEDFAGRPSRLLLREWLGTLQPFCLGDQRVALRSWPWHSLLCVRPGLSRVGRVVAKKSDELTKRRCPRPSVQVQFEGGSEENSHSGDFSSQKIAFTTPPSTRSAAPLVAEDDSPAI